MSCGICMASVWHLLFVDNGTHCHAMRTRYIALCVRRVGIVGAAPALVSEKRYIERAVTRPLSYQQAAEQAAKHLLDTEAARLTRLNPGAAASIASGPAAALEPTRRQLSNLLSTPYPYSLRPGGSFRTYSYSRPYPSIA